MKKSVIALLLILCFLLSAGCTKRPLQAKSSTAVKKIETVQIKPDKLTLAEGESKQLSAVGTGEVLWSSKDERIAAVDKSGTVTGVSAGKTTVQASTKEGAKADCLVTVEAVKPLAAETPKPQPLDGAQITFDDKQEHVISQDGTDCTMIFTMEAVNKTGTFEGQAMLVSVGVKDAGVEIPAVAGITMVSNVSFVLAPEPESEPEQIEESDVQLEPLIDIDYRGEGTMQFIMTEVGFMALEKKGDIGITFDVPFKILVMGDKVAISFMIEPSEFRFEGTIQGTQN